MVNDIIMPAVGMLLGKVEFTELQLVLQSEVLNEAKEVFGAKNPIVLYPQ